MSHFFLKKKKKNPALFSPEPLTPSSTPLSWLLPSPFIYILWSSENSFKIQDFYFLTLTRCNQSIIHHPSANIFSLSWAALDAEVKSQYSSSLKQTEPLDSKSCLFCLAYIPLGSEFSTVYNSDSLWHTDMVICKPQKGF